MESAGRHVAGFCYGPTAVICGPGNNGGDGLVCARHLNRTGMLVSVCCTDPSKFRGAAAQALEHLQRDGVEIATAPILETAELVVDAIFGVGLSRAPQGQFAEWIDAINRSGKRVIAVDVPSGLDADSGAAYDPCVRADVTVTFGLPKPGLIAGDGPRLAGEIWVADIGIPKEAVEALGIQVPDWILGLGSLVKL